MAAKAASRDLLISSFLTDPTRLILFATLFSSRLTLFLQTQMMLINTITLFTTVFWSEVIPGCRLNVTTAIFAPVNVGFEAQDTCIFTTHIAGEHEGADVKTDAVVKVWVPADRLLFQGFTAHENIVGVFAF